MKRIYTFLLAVVLLAGMLVSCQSAVSVNRLSADADIDLSGNWNDTDIRLVSQALVESSLASPWVNQYKMKNPGTGYNGSICATHFGVTVPPISVQFVPVISV